MPFRKAVVSLAVLLLATAPLALAQGTYTQFDVPGALATVGIGIDTAGDVVGYYIDPSANQDGFLLSGGTYTTINYPGSTSTILDGMNDKSQIVGYSTGIGFVYDGQTQSFTNINRPGATFSYPLAINNGGEIAGLVFFGFNQQVGFDLAGSRYKIISPPRTSSSSVVGITSSGSLFGVASAARGTVDFSLSGNTYSQFSIPNAPGAQLFGVNPSGTALVGYYVSTSGVTAGFIYQNKILTTLQFPGSSLTKAFGINAAGEVVGNFEDTQGNGHGFTWTPPADAAKK